MNSPLAYFAPARATAAHGAAVAGHAHRAAAVDQSAAAAGDDDGVGREAANLHRDEILGDGAAAAAGVVEDRGQEVPAFVHRDQPAHVPAADLLVERVEQLLAGGRAGEGGPFEERAAEAALVAEAFLRAIEGDAEAVHQVDDLRAVVDHLLDGRLVLEEVAAVDGVVEVEPLAVALLAGEVVDRVDAALGADAVGALHGREAHQVDGDAELGELHRRGEPREPAANHQYTLLCHAIL